MKRVFFCAFLLFGISLFLATEALWCQSPYDNPEGVNVTVKGRPWELDEARMTVPVDYPPGRDSSDGKISRETRESSSLGSYQDRIELPHGLESRRLHFWPGYRLLFFRLLVR